MNTSGSLCPAVKAADIVGDKWVLLILRELFLGSTRYAEFQRGIPRISPTILSKRLKQLESDGLLIKKSVHGQKSTEYRLTKSGRELAPVIDQLSRWGLRWARRRLGEEDIDVAGFMWDFHRTLNTDELPDGETVFSVSVSDLAEQSKWWLIANGSTVDLCTDDPDKDVDVYITGPLEALVEVWMGDVDVKAAIKVESLFITGAEHLRRSVSHWFPKSMYADVRPAQSNVTADPHSV